MDNQQQPPSFWPEFRGYTGAFPPFGESIFNMPRIGGGYSNPIRHFEQGGPVSPPSKQRRITLTADEASFCRQMRIPYAHFAAHKASLLGSQ
jgi:hypothetical protein